MNYVKSKHDIGIVDVGTGGSGTTLVGMMLVRDKGRPVWAELDGKHLVDQFFTGVPDQVYTDPEKEIILTQSDFRKGFGQYIMDDPQEYFASYGMDLSVKGQAMAGWNSTAATIPTLFSIVDGGLELWTSSSALTNWISASAIIRSSTVYAGTYSAHLTQNRQIYQDATGWSTDFRNKTVTWKEWTTEMQAYVEKKNKKIKKLYFSYTSCPKCAKAYGKNYVVLFAQIA